MDKIEREINVSKWIKQKLNPYQNEKERLRKKSHYDFDESKAKGGKINGKKRFMLSSSFNDWQNWLKIFGRQVHSVIDVLLIVLCYTML